MMRWSSLAVVALLAGCGSSSDSSTDAPPKGNMPTTTQAPPGAKGPQERSMAIERGKNTGDPGGDK